VRGSRPASVPAAPGSQGAGLLGPRSPRGARQMSGSLNRRHDATASDRRRERYLPTRSRSTHREPGWARWRWTCGNNPPRMFGNAGGISRGRCGTRGTRRRCRAPSRPPSGSGRKPRSGPLRQSGSSPPYVACSPRSGSPSFVALRPRALQPRRSRIRPPTVGTLSIPWPGPPRPAGAGKRATRAPQSRPAPGRRRSRRPRSRGPTGPRTW